MEHSETNRTLSPTDWALTIFISSLPLIGIIMLLIWAFGNDGNIHKKNWAKGTLILFLIAIIIGFAFLFLFGGIALISQLAD